MLTALAFVKLVPRDGSMASEKPTSPAQPRPQALFSRPFSLKKMAPCDKGTRKCKGYLALRPAKRNQFTVLPFRFLFEIKLCPKTTHTHQASIQEYPFH